MDKYRVTEWVDINPHTTSCFAFVEPNEGIKQAIVNDIRANGYFFGEGALLGGELQVAPVLNTGSAVLVDEDLCMELVCRAYGLSEEEYESYLHHVVKNPYIDLAPSQKYACEYPTKRVVWINDDAFDDFKDSILGGNSNVEIIPDDYIQLKKGDVIRYVSTDESKCFEVQVKEFIPSDEVKISDIANMAKADTQSILDLFAKGRSAREEHLLYRYDGMKGQDVYEMFERIYGTWWLQSISFGEFNCRINLVVFDKNVDFEQPVLDMPDDIPASEDVLSSVREMYASYLQLVERKKEEDRQRILRLKEKMAKRKNEENK